jgi:hypothetical protein
VWITRRDALHEREREGESANPTALHKAREVAKRRAPTDEEIEDAL